MRITACFDSHVHWAATGEFARRLDLRGLRAPDEVQQLNVGPGHYRDDWLLGFGWDASAWPAPPDRAALDRRFPNVPVVFTRIDGHARWLNSEALRRAGLLDVAATGVVDDRFARHVDEAIPPIDAATVRADLLAGARTFNVAGFTHVRDLTCDERQWREATSLDQSDLLTLAVEEFFWVRGPDVLNHVIELAREARAYRGRNLRARGIKLFYDGALGSEGALLSRCYAGGVSRGLELWSGEDLRRAIRGAWAVGLEVAIHAIGDEAAARVVDGARDVTRAGWRGRLALEHAQILRPETVARMRGLDVCCHVQPSHWLSDRAWLRDKIGDLTRYAFPWRRLQEAGVPVHFGSDAPIEPASVARTLRALDESAAAGVPPVVGPPERLFAHPDPAWAPESYTIFADGHPARVVFRGSRLDQ